MNPFTKFSIIFTIVFGCICHAQQQDPAKPLVPRLPDDEPNAAVDNDVVVEDIKDEVLEALGDTRIKDVIEQPVMTGDIMAVLYREWTGKRVLVSKDAMAKQIAFIQPGNLTYREAAELLEEAALLEDMVFLPSVSNKNVVKLVLATNSRKKGVPVIRDSMALPEGEKVVTYVMVLDHVQPDEALKIFNSVISGLNPQGSIVSVPNTSSLIITESTSLIKTLIDIKMKIDIPQDLSTKKTIELQHADAEEVATQVQEIMDFSAEQNSLVSNNTLQASAPATAKPAETAKNPNIGASVNTSQNQERQNFANVKILAISRTNSIWIMGRPIDIKFAETIVADFDKPIKRSSYYRHQLRFLSVSEFLPIAQNAIKRKEGGTGVTETCGQI